MQPLASVARASLEIRGVRLLLAGLCYIHTYIHTYIIYIYIYNVIIRKNVDENLMKIISENKINKKSAQNNNGPKTVLNLFIHNIISFLFFSFFFPPRTHSHLNFSV